MDIFHDWQAPGIQTPSVLTMGVFDGLHLGHQTIIRRVVERAAALECASTVVTFDPHPRAVLYPDAAPPLLQTLGQRLEALKILGVRQTLVLHFDQDLAALTAAEFAERLLFKALGAREIHLGENFVFGRGRQGNIATLRCLGVDYGCAAYEVESVVLRGRRVSSTRLREAIQSGQINLARRMLSRPYGVEGEVVAGRRLGRTLDFPTANIAVINRVLPADGVYVTATLIRGVWRRSVTNIGVRPTVSGDRMRVVETHILDFSGELYGTSLRTRFLHRLRPEQKFASLDDLRAQIGRDVARARRYFRHPGVRRSLAVE
ncbi:MAG: bifunctional riboflavin kinase/FAD synthetase [Chloracidobacterium sp.]|uniref:Riboflavin biosynthesis protein n=1 Tax=Chloracidobacterium validum TaxID=2821543 RepID=A0ABX8B9S2_9BACT|nr:bifunctional riboflavin kinase/FAD synthetase [Chloracidobacterium validum]QUW03421.1 bifunctional riboflavin kinase/FAD synthetase [Chloracidobacterium validum]